ncbi:MAG: DNA mismatch repair protein MutS, partial [Candidatus Eremiobacteraeota bacterium]|nr:DNA mismatch repair protein MutS [Candidatus Eremiobacteraeota bacterium]
QYFGMKARYPEALLLSRVGDFYEAYGDDAQTLSRAISIALTSKEAGAGQRIAMAGVPHHALDSYLAKLVAQRRVVALAEQLDAPVPNKLVRRDVVRVVTPGTLVEDPLLERGANNFLCAVTSVGDALGFASADLSTGYVAATAISGESALEDLHAELARIGPSEVVADVAPDLRAELERTLESTGARITASSLAAVNGRPRALVDGFDASENAAIFRALDAISSFVKRVGFGDERVSALRPPVFYARRGFLALDPSSRKHLELTRALGQNEKATLLATLDCTKTAMGSRLLSRWLLAPLVEREAIERRGDAVETLVGDVARRDALASLLDGCFDLERIAQKIRLRRVLPRDLASLQRTLALLDPLLDVLRETALPAGLRGCASAIGDFTEMAQDLARTLVADPPATLAEGGVIRPESHPDLSETVALRTDARSRIAALEERERERTGIRSLRVKYASAFGYAIEVGKSNLGAVPPDYVRRQTLTTGERFVTPELRELDLAIANAQTRQRQLEGELFETLVERVAVRADDLLRAADALAEIDVYCALAQIAAERGYVRPHLVDETRIAIDDGRHPVMEHILGTHFVPNDLRLETERSRFIVLTGPNMGGKSTYLRQTALLVVMAQIGSFVPAKSMELGIVERIFTRIGAGDDLASGQSTFYVEMLEASNILRRATQRSLLLIDEVGRGTGTVDGLAIAQAICEYLLEQDKSGPMVLFATHFHELVALGERWPLVSNFHITAVENTKTGAPVFSHRVLPGSSSRSFGIEVAKMAGLPPGVIGRAKEIAEALVLRPTLEDERPLRGRLHKASAAQPGLFDQLR